MPRVKKSVASRARRKKFLGMAKGYRSGRHRLYRSAREAVERALTFAYRDRKVRKREFRSLWIVRLNAALRLKKGPDQPGSQGPGRPGGLRSPRIRPGGRTGPG
jgi:ribosomal protein L20